MSRTCAMPNRKPFPTKEPIMTIFPTFFRTFACKADKCRHTCCQKWVINIDPESAGKYRNTKGSLGEELRAWMSTDEADNPCFKLNEKGYCHFLNEQGLCRLVLEKGPKFLCQICRDHPRFYVYSCDEHLDREDTLAGTGLACEETVELLMAEDGEIVFETDDGSFPIYFDDLTSTHFMKLPKELQSFHPDFKKEYIDRLLKRLEETNPIDTEWTESLHFIKDHKEELVKKAEGLMKEISPIFLTNLYRYIIYRQMCEFEMYDPEDIAFYSGESVTFILLEYARTHDLIRSVTRWSEQVEYDTENVYILLDRISEMDTPLDTPAE